MGSGLGRSACGKRDRLGGFLVPRDEVLQRVLTRLTRLELLRRLVLRM